MKTNSNISQDLLETVERYLNGHLQADERTAFESRLAEDPEFKSQVDDLRILILGIESQALKEQLETYHEQLSTPSEQEHQRPKVLFPQFRKLAAAAVVVIALGSFWYYQHTADARFYDSHFKPDPGLPTTMGSTDNFAFYNAMVNYKQQDYPKAIAKWEVLHKSATTNDTLNYFLGVAHLADGRAEEAIPYLETVTESGSSGFQNEAFYYLGFAYLKKEDLPMARRHFELSNLEAAKSILAELND